MKFFTEKLLEIKIFKKKKEIFNNFTKKLYDTIKEDLDHRSKNFISKKLSEKCSPLSPICIPLIEKTKLKKKKKNSFFIFRQGFSPNLITDYFPEKNNNHRQTIYQESDLKLTAEKELQKKIENSIVVGRHHHICVSEKLRRSDFRKNNEIHLEIPNNPNLVHNEKKRKSIIRHLSHERKESKIKKDNNNIKNFVYSIKDSFCVGKEREMSLNLPIETRKVNFMKNENTQNEIQTKKIVFTSPIQEEEEKIYNLDSEKIVNYLPKISKTKFPEERLKNNKSEITNQLMEINQRVKEK